MFKKRLDELGENKNMNKCWRKGGCPFNSNTSLKYLKCMQDDYSILQCKEDNEMNPI